MTFSIYNKFKQLLAGRPVIIGMLTCALLGCSSEEDSKQGFISAPEGGDLSFPLQDRISHDDEVRRVCGELELAESSIVRSPYVQRVSESEAHILWTSSERNLAIRIGDGLGSETVSVERDESATPLLAEQFVATIGQLSTNTLYCYELRRGDTTLYRSGFRTAPDTTAEIRFSALGDLGKNTSDQLAVLEQLKAVRSDLLLFTGDVAYENGTLAQYESYFFTVYEDLLDHIPTFPASGNHDYRTDDADPFREVFLLPENGGTEGLERWYSFDWGPVHFAVLDTEVLIPEQADWLAQDLRGTDRWKIVVLHKPLYSSGFYGVNDYLVEHLEPVFQDHNVALVLAGHEHDYERTTAIGGVHYVVTGGGGRGTRNVGTSSFTGFSARVAHFVNVEANASTLTLHAIDGTGREFDSLRITR